MRVLTVPPRLKAAVALLALAVPLAAGEVLIVTRAPWWKIPYRSVEFWAAAVALIAFPIAVWIAQGRRWAVWILAAFAISWIALSATLALRLANPSLGFFTALLLAYFGLLHAWIRHEIDKSYFDPRIRWFQGRPPAIPGLACELAAEEGKPILQVGRMDGEGAFVFAAPSATFRLQPATEAEMIFTYKERQVRCRGQVMRALGQRSDGAVGAGFQFRGMSADERKDLGDFVEMLRGEGHV